MYYFAEHYHFSGVLSVVSGALFLSSQRQNMLSYTSRLQGINVWTNIVFVMNGLIFLLIGLQLPSIVQQLGDISLSTAIWYGLVISLVLIVGRLLCTYGAVIFTRFMSHYITVADANPGWRTPMVFGWAGMRGVVSLAAALSIPLLGSAGQPFPFRNLILFITFIVILVTLVFQGLTLPWIIRKFHPEDRFSPISERKQEEIMQKKMAMVSLQLLEEKYGEERKRNAYLDNLFTRLEMDTKIFQEDLQMAAGVSREAQSGFQLIYLELLERQRKLLYDLNHRDEFDEDLVRKYLSLIDLEEFKVREKIINDPMAVAGKDAGLGTSAAIPEIRAQES